MCVCVLRINTIVSNILSSTVDVGNITSVVWVLNTDNGGAGYSVTLFGVDDQYYKQFVFSSQKNEK